MPYHCAYFMWSLSVLQLIPGTILGLRFDTISYAGAISGFVSIVFIPGRIFMGPLWQILGNRPFLQIAGIIPTYYLADGMVSAI